MSNFIKQARQDVPTVLDLFCGAGGSTTGAKLKGARVTGACNHSRQAIETHNTNHPEVTHYLTDIQTANPRHFPRTDWLIASPECTNHTLAKGKKRTNLGQYELFSGTTPQLDPLEERSRTTMFDPLRFAEVHNYDVMVLENVVDVVNWIMFGTFLHGLDTLGYHYRIVSFNSQFAYPVPQSRDRVYIVCWKKNHPTPNLDFKPKGWCLKCEREVHSIQSWKNPKLRVGKYGKMGQYLYCCPRCSSEVRPYYYPAWTALDFSLPIGRIGDRAKPLAEKTMQRLRLGIDKYYNHQFHSQPNLQQQQAGHAAQPEGARHQPNLAPLVVDTAYTHARTVRGYPATAPCPTQTGHQGFGMLTPTPFMQPLLYAERQARSVNEPTLCQTQRQDVGLVVPPAHLFEYYREGQLRDLNDVTSTIVAGGNHHWLLSQAPNSLLMAYYGTGNCEPTSEPSGTITTISRYALVDNKQHSPAEVDEKQKQAGQGRRVEVEDCYFRMLDPDREIKRIMGFASSYQVLGNQREQVHQLGNAVTPPVMEMLFGRLMQAEGYTSEPGDLLYVPGAED